MERLRGYKKEVGMEVKEGKGREENESRINVLREKLNV